MKRLLNLIVLLSCLQLVNAQELADSCKLNIGTNLSGLADWGTEIPFVDLMRASRTWYTKSIDDPNYPFNSEQANALSYRADGYPTHIPQEVAGSPYLQEVATIWAITDGWPSGNYTLLWEGNGTLELWGGYSNMQQNGNRITFDFMEPVGNILELKISYSDINNPLHNIRLLMPGTEQTYQTQPFYQLWLDKLEPFKTVRFMDWGQTNNWGQTDPYTWDDPTLFDWNDRIQPDFYTWTTSKGVPYEMMVELMNSQDKDGWVCIPHRASPDYIQQMALYFKENLEPGRHLYVEYSNEIWNWIFGQAHWLLKYGCELQGVDWPEGTVPYIQNNLDIWTNVFSDQPERITRVVGTFTAWLDVSQRIVNNLDPNTFDAVSPTYYFGLSEEADIALDAMGPNADVTDISNFVREGMPEGLNWIQGIKDIADNLNKKLVFYEGGQHITAHPFGEEPSYANALLDIQRDTAMYNLYNEWFDALRAFQEGADPLLLMNYSFTGGRSARYGSWGILETMDQDITTLPAPKYQAVLENMNLNCLGQPTSTVEVNSPNILSFTMYPNPATESLILDFYGKNASGFIQIYSQQGQLVLESLIQDTNRTNLNIQMLVDGIYTIRFQDRTGKISSRKLVKMK